ncbi:hypothetical protein HPP92_004398 [Vanilla planifolia]|uniref:Uncharacterized protein n=1 Tax=Vanilla planifolia TaxID=51239 RepID=A0A835VAC5_VANPL|nr:hypothetical protein HPP92_004398 [Vanilla planifolia]
MEAGEKYCHFDLQRRRRKLRASGGTRFFLSPQITIAPTCVGKNKAESVAFGRKNNLIWPFPPRPDSNSIDERIRPGIGEEADEARGGRVRNEVTLNSWTIAPSL